MPVAYLLCGKTGSGKTSYARSLEADGVVRFSLDEWMIRLFGHHMSREEFNARTESCMSIILTYAERLIRLGIPVALDCGFWDREGRREARRRLEAAGATVELRYFLVPDDELWLRLSLRNENPPPDTYEITREMFEMFGDWFEPPLEDEAPIVTP